MNPSVKHWIIGGCIIVFLLACVILYAVFGDVTMPGEANLTINENYSLVEYEITGEESLAGSADDVLMLDGMSAKQSLNYYCTFLSISNIKFDKNNRMHIVYRGEDSIYEYSQNGSKLTLSETDTNPFLLSFQKSDASIKNNLLVFEMQLKGFTAITKHKIITEDINISGKDFSFKNYELKTDDTIVDVKQKEEIQAKSESIKTALSYSWLRFQTLKNNVYKLNIVNGSQELTNWEYSKIGTCVYMTETENTENQKKIKMSASIKDLGGTIDLTMKTVSEQITETIVYTYSSGKNYVPMQDAISIPVKNKTIKLMKEFKNNKELGYGNITWGTGLLTDFNKLEQIRIWISKGLYKGSLTGMPSVDIENFENFVRLHNYTMYPVLEKIILPSQGNLCSVVEYTGMEGTIALQNKELFYNTYLTQQGQVYIYLFSKGIPTIMQNDFKDQFQSIMIPLQRSAPLSGSSITNLKLVMPTPFDNALTFSLNYQVS